MHEKGETFVSHSDIVDFFRQPFSKLLQNLKKVPLDQWHFCTLLQLQMQFSVKGKATDFTLPRTGSGQASRPYETVPIGTILSPSEGGRKPQGENYQALVVKGERHHTCGPESESIPDCSRERRTCYHGAPKPQLLLLLLCRMDQGSRGTTANQPDGVE